MARHDVPEALFITAAAAIYCRKSTLQSGADAEATSVARQIERARLRGPRLDGHRPACLRRRRRQRRGDAQAGQPSATDLHAIAARAVPGLVRPRCLPVQPARRRRGFGELKRIAQAGIAIWFYQDSPAVHATAPSATTRSASFAAELNAEFRARDRRNDRKRRCARKAQAGHVTGGRVFGYDNVKVERAHRAPINDADSRDHATDL